MTFGSNDARPVADSDRIGLCATCAHMRRMQNDRGSTFYLCQLSATDSRFRKYPRLPMIACLGYQDRARDSSVEEG